MIARLLLLAAAPAAALPRFDLAPAEVEAECRAALGRASTALAAVASLPPSVRTFDNTVAALDRAREGLNDAAAPLALLAHVSGSREVRAAARACGDDVARFVEESQTRGDLAAALRAWSAGRPRLRGEDGRLLDALESALRRGGADLPPARREELRAARRRLAELEARLTVEDSAAETEADPRLRRRAAAERGARLERENLPLLAEALERRREAARALGLSSHAELALEGTMAGTPRAARAFLERLASALRRAGRRELRALNALKAGIEGPDAAPLDEWDLPYYRRRAAEASGPGPRFPAGPTLDLVLDLAAELTGTRLRRVREAAAWSADVRLYEVRDRAGDRLLGRLYLDPARREAAPDGPAVFDLARARTGEDGERRPALAVLLAGLPPGETPLAHAQVHALLAGLGRALTICLSQARHGRSGPAGVERDAADAPALALAEWAWEPAVLKRLSGGRLTDDEIARLLSARRSGAALEALRQAALAEVDLAFHGPRPPKDLGRACARALRRVALVPLAPGSRPEAGFAHLLGGYDAAYYGYLWSEALAQDLFAAWSRPGPFDPVAAARFRAEVLEKTGTRPTAESVRVFLGRGWSEEAFLKRLGAGT